MLKILQVRTKTYFVGKIHNNFPQVSPASLQDVSAGNYQRTLVGESGMIKTKMGLTDYVYSNFTLSLKNCYYLFQSV
jgi:hypothetical protein